MKFKNLEDKCRYYQSVTNYKLVPNSYVICHLDGKNFSRLIKNNFKKPFDKDFIIMMNNTAKFLCENVQGCKLAYVQSDEISLLITDFDTPDTDMLFGGRLCKIQSILAALATSEFNRQFILYNIYHGDKRNIGAGDCVDIIENMKMAQFDCKCWTVPNLNDAFAWFLYRSLDCTKNSMQQTAQTYLSHKELLKLDAKSQIGLLKEKKGIDWENDFSNGEKYGRIVYKQNCIFEKVIKGETIKFERKKFNVFEMPFCLSDENGKEYFIQILENNNEEK